MTAATGWAADAGGVAHCFVDDVAVPAVHEADEHHLVRVLRVRAGETVTVADGQGRWRACTVTTTRPVVLEPAGEVIGEPEPDPPVTVAFAPTKGERPAWAVQKLTELGVDTIGILVTARSVVRWDAVAATRPLARLEAVAREAAMQSRRARLPRIVGPLPPAAWPAPAVICDRGGGPPTLDRPVVLVGPEGGWAADDGLDDLPRCSLGPTVLRAETATVAAGVLLVALRGGTVRSRRVRELEP